MPGTPFLWDLLVTRMERLSWRAIKRFPFVNWGNAKKCSLRQTDR